MSWSFRIKHRDKMALAFGCVFLIIVLANWFVSYSMSQVSGQFKSVYQDRLVPALDISAILERYYQNRMLLEEHIIAGDPAEQAQLEKQIKTNLHEIDSLHAKFEATYLTNQESKDLHIYKAAIGGLTKVQNETLELSRRGDKAAAITLYKTQGNETFQELLRPLHALSQLQEQVGHELYASADRQMKSLKVLSYMVIGMAVFLALIVGTLLQSTRKITNIKPQKFHLN
ncbi:MAG: MCP four helix bundle domain-containing protein [Hymenobacteraceae bacterium]|nr:MCP four helix bundle domain-containing protein [Hymenobacteraceae bacterium]MDX5481983.1 MCP four helix bundle domain-containing protein [Hymenobacteraceae bacterium]